MEMDGKIIGGLLAAMVVGGGSGGGVMNSINTSALELELAAKAVETAARNEAVLKLVSDTRLECKEAREAQAKIFSDSYEALLDLRREIRDEG